MKLTQSGTKLRQDLDDILQGIVPNAHAMTRAKHAEVILALFQAEVDAKGEVTVTKNERGEIIAVTRQDEDHRILEIIAQPGLTPAQAASFAEVNRLMSKKAE